MIADVDFRSLVAAAKTFKKETKRRTKAVRFLTPQKSDVLSYDVTDEEDDDIKENVDLENLPLVNINIPVRILIKLHKGLVIRTKGSRYPLL